VFTARYALSPYIKQTRFVFKGLMSFQIYYVCVCYGVVKTVLDLYFVVTCVVRFFVLCIVLCICFVYYPLFVFVCCTVPVIGYLSVYSVH
jgi:hypothetical protein